MNLVKNCEKKKCKKNIDNDFIIDIMKMQANWLTSKKEGVE